MAATIYEPLSTAHLKSCTVDFDSRPDKKAVNLVQYDQTIPILCVSLKKGGTEYKVPSDADVNIRMDKRDGYHVYNPALGVNAERTIAYFAVTTQMSTGWGDYYPIVEITVGGGIAGSAPIWLHFDRNPLPENAIISSDEYKTIQQLLEDVTAVKAATEQIKAQTEAVRDQAKGFADNAKNSADKAQTLVDGMPSDYSQAMKDIGTLKNQMQRAYPDDSTIGENPWSSKNIVDMLCPPIEESGNPVVCYPVAGYPLGVKASWEPMQGGTGTPSPENIRPIKGRDSVRVERCGENLFDIAKVTETNILTKTDRQITLKAGRGYNYDLFVSSVGLTTDVPTNLFDRLPFFPKGTYKISYNATAPNARLAIVAVAKDGSITVISTNPHVDFTLSYGTLISIRCDIREEVTLSNIQITIGATAPTTYTPYIGSTNTLTLPETVYGGEVDAVTGDGKETWKLATLDGNSTVTTYRENDDTDTYKGFAVYNAIAGVDIHNNAACSHFKRGLASSQGYYPNTFLAHEDGTLYIRTEIPGITSVETFKAYIAAQYAAGTPVQVGYKLAEPVPFTATGAQALPALAGVNTVLTDANSMTVTGRADPIKRITDLEDATASQT